MDRKMTGLAQGGKFVVHCDGSENFFATAAEAKYFAADTVKEGWWRGLVARMGAVTCPPPAGDNEYGAWLMSIDWLMVVSALDHGKVEIRAFEDADLEGLPKGKGG